MSVDDRTFARTGHMVQNKLCLDANKAVGLPKQRNSYQSSPTLLCFGSPTALFASQRNLCRTMWPDRAKGVLQALFQLDELLTKLRLANHSNKMLPRLIKTLNRVGGFCKAIQHCLGRTRRANIWKSFKFHFTWQLGVAGAALLVA